MNRSRRVGGLTAGISLVVFGIFFAAGMIIPSIKFGDIISFWPVIFILLGGEILFNYFTSGNERAGYDIFSVAIVFVMLFFALCMAGAQVLIDYYDPALIPSASIIG